MLIKQRDGRQTSANVPTVISGQANANHSFTDTALIESDNQAARHVRTLEINTALSFEEAV